MSKSNPVVIGRTKKNNQVLDADKQIKECTECCKCGTGLAAIFGLISLIVWAAAVHPNMHDMRNEVESRCFVQNSTQRFSTCCDSASSCSCSAFCSPQLPLCSAPGINRTTQCCGSTCCVTEVCTTYCKVTTGIYVCCWDTCVQRGADICSIRCGQCLDMEVHFVRDDQPHVQRALQFRCGRDDASCVADLRRTWATDTAHTCYYDRRKPEVTVFDETRPNHHAVNAMWTFAAFAFVGCAVMLCGCCGSMWWRAHKKRADATKLNADKIVQQW